MRMKVRHDGGARFTVCCRDHEVTMDQPEENAGSDAGMTPPEFMAASLAGCIGFYVARYCEQAKIDATGLEVGCDWSIGGNPKRFEAIEVNVVLPGMPENRRKAVERVAQSCLIHATLLHGTEMDIRIN
jgi:uncharacterized OsmC-like protein